jgi:energy-coupling factor transporter ATPase
VTELSLALHERHPDFPPDLLTVEEVVAAVRKQLEIGDQRPISDLRSPIFNLQSPVSDLQSPVPDRQPLISVQNLAHYYMRGTPLEVKAVADIDMEIHAGEIVGIIGHTGSGKSTVVQHFNGLMRPHEGTVTVFGQAMSDPALDLMTIRRRVGLVFQQPEAQLFEQYVGDDVAYGPRNLKLSREEVRARVRKAMEAVGLGFEEFKDRLTFSLSGGQLRRVALAGVLALEPEVLVLDEPTAGLDPASRQRLLEQLLALHQQGVTLVIISHNMEELAAICHRLYVLAEGRTLMAGPPAEVFADPARLLAQGLGVPAVTQVMAALAQAGLVRVDTTVYTLEQAVAVLSAALGGSKA